jgi:hypothetical protein
VTNQKVVARTSLKKYRVILTAKSGARLPEKVRLDLNFTELNSENSRVIVENILEKDPTGVLVPIGLRYVVEITASSLDDALTKGTALSDGVTSFVSLSARLGLPVARQELIYEITPGISDREFLQLFHDLRVDLPKKSIDPAFLITSVERAIDEKDERKRDRISRAVRWYRKGAVSTDVFDRFISYWTGLEALNPLLQDTFRVTDPSQATGPTVTGIRAFMQKFYSVDLYRRAHVLRVDLVHSTKPLGTLTSEATNLEIPIGEALRRSIYFLLGSDVQQDGEGQTRSATIPMTMVLVGTIHGTDPNELGPPGEQPHLEVAGHDVIGTIVGDSKIERTITSNFTVRAREGVSISITGWRLYGPTGATGELHNVKVSRKGQDGTPKPSSESAP